MTRQRLFDISWKLTLFVLPWQTRYFHDATLAGWPWEQGRWSVYVSWFLIVATVALGWPSFRRSLVGPKKRVASYVLAGLFACTFVPILFHSDQPVRFVAVSQWWIEVLLLMGFGLTVSGARIPWRSIATWFVASLIPQAVLGIVQYAMQDVIGTKWLGIAIHLSKVPGTSVVEFGLFRYLRVYGGFPHPNIFGGWLAVGLVAALALAGIAATKRQAIFAIGSSALFSMVLVLTFSRSGWIAAVAGIVVLVGARFIAPVRPAVIPEGVMNRASTRQFFYLALVASLLAAGIISFSQRAVVFARADTSDRLEAKSIGQRTQSLKDGLALFSEHPIIGAGPNAELVDLRNLDAQKAGKPTAQFKAPEPLEPPADAYLLILADLGIVGTVLLVAFLTQTIPHIPRSAWPFVACFAVISLLDYYTWSTWAGMGLVMVILVLAAMQPSLPSPDTTHTP